MSVLGNLAIQPKVNNPSSLGELLGGLIKRKSSQQEYSFLESILDANGDGSIIDHVAGKVLGGIKKKGGLGGLLGRLFGHKKKSIYNF